MRIEEKRQLDRDVRQSDCQCGLWRMPLIYGGLLGGVGFLDCARNDGGFAKQSDSQIKESTIKIFLIDNVENSAD